MAENKDKVYDFIIIGSGMGGLVSALLLAKHGYRVCVLEKNNQIGGALQVYSRNKRIFDTGVHYIGGLDKGESLYKIFNYLDIYDGIKPIRMDDAFDIIRLPNGKQFRQGQGYDHFIRFLEEDFPQEKQAIRVFVEEVQKTCRLFPLYNLSAEKQESYLNSELMQTGAWDFINTITTNQDLIAALLGNGILYGGNKKRTPWYVVALILNSYITGSYRLTRGGASLIKTLQKQIRKYGGELLKRKEVVGIKKEDKKRIKSLICSDGTQYSATNYVSNIHPYKTMEIIGFEHFRPATVKRISQLRNTVSCFMVNIALKENAFVHVNHNYYDFFTPDIWDTVDYDPKTWPQVIFSCTSSSSSKSQYAQVFSAMTYLNGEEFATWRHTHNTILSPSDRGADYQAKKNELQKKVIDKLCERFPTLREAILAVYTSSSLTFRDYIGGIDGEIYGIEKDFTQGMMTNINTKTNISNLYLTGQNIIFHGILGATIGAILTSFHFLDAQQLIDDINKY